MGGPTLKGLKRRKGAPRLGTHSCLSDIATAARGPARLPPPFLGLREPIACGLGSEHTAAPPPDSLEHSGTYLAEQRNRGGGHCGDAEHLKADRESQHGPLSSVGRAKAHEVLGEHLGDILLPR